MLISTIGKIEKFWKSLRIRQAIAIAPSLVSPPPLPVRLPCQPARVCPRLPAIGAGHDIGGRLASDPHVIRENRVSPPVFECHSSLSTV